MDDTSTWNVRPEEEKANKLKFLRSQERVAKGFYGLALKELDVLDKLLELLPELFLAVPALAEKLASMCMKFFFTLCGPRSKELKLKHPEKYRFDPKQLLRLFVTLTCRVANDKRFLKELIDGYDFGTKIECVCIRFYFIFFYNSFFTFFPCRR